MKNIVIIIACITLTSTVFSQEPMPEFDNVRFEMEYFLRIPYNKVSIDFKTFLQEKKVEVKVRSSSLKNSERWNYANIDTTITFDYEKFIAITDSIYKINPRNLIDNVKSFGVPAPELDGYSCKLQFGRFSSYVTYTIHSPSAKEKLQNFYHVCLFIIKSVGLEPFEILEEPTTEKRKADALEYLRKLE